MMQNTGTLVVQVSAAGAAYPIEGASVIVESDDEYDRIRPMTDETDADGNTRPFILPTPPRVYSLSPDEREIAYATYRVLVSKMGYRSKLLRNMPMFEGIATTLPVNLVPDALYSRDENGPVFGDDDDLGNYSKEVS